MSLGKRGAALLFARFVTSVPLIVTLLVHVSQGQSPVVLHSFSANGISQRPQAAVTEGTDSLLYGTSVSSAAGSVFKLSTSGIGSELYAFGFTTKGSGPSRLTLASDGTFYGTTPVGGSANLGVLFRINSNGDLTILHEFAGAGDGESPRSAPVEASDGNLYGTTFGDGSNVVSTVYKYTRSGVYSIIYRFDGTSGQGAPGPLVQGFDGKLYGVAVIGGTSGCGAVFSIRIPAVVVRSYSFHCRTGGANPLSLIQASDGSFYGVTNFGGRADAASSSGFGTIFKFAPQNGLTILYRFQGNKDGAYPEGAAIQATDGNLYGTTLRGGTDDIGTIFRITTDGNYKQLYSFQELVGKYPEAPLMQHTNGVIYGTANQGGAHGTGDVFSLDLGLGPFITFVRPSGAVGHIIHILGQGLTGATSVTFNGVTAASFKVERDTYMTATVPNGATTGPVVVVTPSGTLTSNVNFRVVP